MRDFSKLGAATLLGLFGCTTTYQSVGAVAAEVRQDEVATAVNWKDESVGLQGRVKDKGLRTEKAAEVNGLGSVFMFGATEVKLTDKAIAFVDLESTTAQPGKALCLFEPWAFPRLATVHEGESVTLSCHFFEVKGAPGDRVPVFHKCFVDE